MDMRQLLELLQQNEGPTLEFKQGLNIYIGGEGEKRSRHELIKDILSLANGNASVAGLPKYLVIGAEDKQNPDGSRNLHHISGQYPTRGDLLKMLRDACYPPLETIEVEPITIDGNRLLVITIPPTLYLHETIKKLDVPSGQYFNEHTVFIRHDENIVIASASERAAIQRAKEKHFNERNDVPPVEFGAGVGGILLSIVGRSVAQKQFKLGAAGQAGAAFVTGLAGASMGAIMGKSYKDWRYIKSDWQDLPPIGRILVISIMVPFVVALRWLIVKVFRQLQKLNGQT